MDSIASAILVDITAYCGAVGIAPTTFGQRAVGDTRFVERLREGRASVRQVDRARQYMADNPPPSEEAA
jgi:hypothetical protein